MNVIHQSRILLIRFAKVFPFVLCFLVAISFSETMFAVISNNYADMDGAMIPCKPISWYIANYYEYGIYSLLVAAILSISLETCIWNKISIFYLAVQLLEKTYLSDIELTENVICIICTLNIIVCAVLVYKGFKMLKLC